jgi:hypothetical protein
MPPALGIKPIAGRNFLPKEDWRTEIVWLTAFERWRSKKES